MLVLLFADGVTANAAVISPDGVAIVVVVDVSAYVLHVYCC